MIRCDVFNIANNSEQLSEHGIANCFWVNIRILGPIVALIALGLLS
jgi:hypothetical protein